MVSPKVKVITPTILPSSDGVVKEAKCAIRYLRETLNIPNCQIVMRVDSETWNPQQKLVSFKTRYFISSIDPNTVTDAKLNRLVRGHWQVENCLHLVKDRWGDEDKHYLKRPGLGTAFAVLLNAALAVLR